MWGSPVCRYATLYHLAARVRCLTLFVTHYLLLSRLADVFPATVRDFHMSFMQTGNEEGAASILFLYKLVAGAAPGSYGLNVARLAKCGRASFALAFLDEGSPSRTLVRLVGSVLSAIWRRPGPFDCRVCVVCPRALWCARAKRPARSRHSSSAAGQSTSGMA